MAPHIIPIDPFSYRHSRVIGHRIITGNILDDDDNVIGLLPNIYGMCIYRDFAVYHRVIGYYIDLNEDAESVITTHNLFDSMESCLGKIQVDLQQNGRDIEIPIWRDAFNQLVDRYQTIRA